MRERLNNDPKVQLIVLGIAGIAVAFLLVTRVFAGGGSGASSDDAATEPVSTGTGAPAATAPPAESAVTPPATSAPVGSAEAPPAAAAGSSEALLPTKGLPADVLVAYARNKVVVLLVIDPGSLGADKLKSYTRRLRSRDDVALFVVPAKDVARYSRITSGVSVTQTPALVVVRPRNLNRTTPTASVSYGFRGPKSVAQAVDDALYEGGQVPSYPRG